MLQIVALERFGNHACVSEIVAIYVVSEQRLHSQLQLDQKELLANLKQVNQIIRADSRFSKVDEVNDDLEQLLRMLLHNMSLELTLHLNIAIVATELKESLEVLRLAQDYLRMALDGSLGPVFLVEDKCNITSLVTALI